MISPRVRSVARRFGSTTVDEVTVRLTIAGDRTGTTEFGVGAAARRDSDEVLATVSVLGKRELI